MKLFRCGRKRFTLRYDGGDGLVKKVHPGDTLIIESRIWSTEGGASMSGSARITTKYDWDGEMLRLKR